MNASASSGALGPAAQEKPFACPVPGCKKRYKNVNGIKYHSKNGHKKDGKVKKAYRCQCGKSYKTAQGLKSHSISQHIASEPKPPAPRMPGLVVTSSPAQSRTLNLIDAVDANKLVRIYDNIKTKDLPAFTVPKHSLASVSVVSARHPGLLTAASTPGSSPADKLKFERAPKLTVQHALPHLTSIYGSDATN